MKLKLTLRKNESFEVLQIEFFTIEHEIYIILNKSGRYSIIHSIVYIREKFR